MTETTPIQAIRPSQRPQPDARAKGAAPVSDVIMGIIPNASVSQGFLTELSAALESSLQAFPREVAQRIGNLDLNVQVAPTHAELLDLESLLPEDAKDESLVLLGHMFYAWLTGKAVPQEPRDIKALAGIRALLNTQKAKPVDLLTDLSLLSQAAHCYFSRLMGDGNMAPIYTDSRTKRLKVSEKAVEQQIFQAGLPATTYQAKITRLTRCINLALAGAMEELYGKTVTQKAFSEHPVFRRAITRDLNQMMEKRLRLTRMLPVPAGPRIHPVQLTFPARISLPIHYEDAYREILASLGSGGIYQNTDIQRHFPEALAVVRRQLGLS